MRSGLASLLSIPFSLPAGALLILGLLVLVLQVVYWLQLGHWFSAHEFMRAVELRGQMRGNVTLANVLQHAVGSVDSQEYVQMLLARSSDWWRENSWLGVKKFIAWVLSFHPIVSGFMFGIPVLLIHAALGAEMGEEAPRKPSRKRAR